MKLKIITHYDYPPIPVRSYDWCAHLDGYDGAPDAGTVGNWIGMGATKAEAVADLLDQIADFVEERLEEFDD